MNNIKKILHIAIPIPKRCLFDYLPPTNYAKLTSLAPGMRIKVPFGNRKLVGILIKITNKSDCPPNKLKNAIAILDTEVVIDSKMLNLGLRIANYYQYPIGNALSSFIPAILRRGEAFPTPTQQNYQVKYKTELKLNSQQQAALKTINSHSNQFAVFLLDGITGSGKTEIYLQAIKKILQTEKQILVLLPEINLTPQTIKRFTDRFSTNIVTIHSRITEKKRLHFWLEAKFGSAKIIIGTRSAVFTPMLNPGMIIVDEEHDLSYKQQDKFRYHARDVAILRAQAENIPIILGSATPSLKSINNLHLKHYYHLKLTKRAGFAKPPTIQLTNICNLRLKQGLAPSTINEIKQHLAAGHQAMIFLNRRGFAHTLMCNSCGWSATCTRCEINMVWHKVTKQLICHHCLRTIIAPTQCKSCDTKNLQHTGRGTQQLEENLAQLFPNVSILRIDQDTTKRKGTMQQALESIQTGKSRLLTGTQILAKGHHFPNVSLVVVLDIDGGFFSADFYGSERTGQMLLQVSGRAGREKTPGRVLIQTRNPNHPLLNLLIKQGYPEFAKALIEERKQTNLPPFSYLALFRAEANIAAKAINFLQTIAEKLQANKLISALGPVTAPIAKCAGKYRYQLLIQSNQRAILEKTLTNLLPTIENLKTSLSIRWSVDVDPVEMY